MNFGGVCQGLIFTGISLNRVIVFCVNYVHSHFSILLKLCSLFAISNTIVWNNLRVIFVNHFSCMKSTIICYVSEYNLSVLIMFS